MSEQRHYLCVHCQTPHPGRRHPFLCESCADREWPRPGPPPKPRPKRPGER